MILEFTHRTLPPHMFTARHAHFERMRAEVLPDDPPYDLSSAWAHFRQRPKRWRFTTWVFWHHGRIAAEANLGFVDLPSNPHLSHPYVSVEPELRRHGIGARLLALAVAGAIRERRQLLITSTTDGVPAGRRFAERYGFRRGIETHLNQLALTGLDHGLMAHWITAASERAADYVVEIWDGLIPESDIVGFADLATVMNSAPRGRLTIDDMKITPEMIRDSERWLFADGSRRLTGSLAIRKVANLSDSRASPGPRSAPPSSGKATQASGQTIATRALAAGSRPPMPELCSRPTRKPASCAPATPTSTRRCWQSTDRWASGHFSRA